MARTKRRIADLKSTAAPRLSHPRNSGSLPTGILALNNRNIHRPNAFTSASVGSTLVLVLISLR